MNSVIEQIAAFGASPAYCTAEGATSFATIADEAARWNQHLRARPETTWGLHLRDTRAFAPILLGLLASGKAVRLLPHLQSGLLDELVEQLDALIIDEPYASSSIPVLCSPSVPNTVPAFETEAMQPLAFYTSGSTGQGKMFLKHLGQLQAEVSVLDTLWGDPTRETGVCATVSHQHIYGFLFKFLWPLLSGRSVWSEACFYPADIQDAATTLKRCVLVSTPSHLKRLPALLDWEVLRKSCTAIYSSGGPLPETAAQAIYQGLGQAPFEIFGSTETGGVAWRRQAMSSEPARWTPFSGIALRQDPHNDCLKVSSPYIHPDECEAGWYSMQDRVALEPDGRFQLLGRIDRIVKIEQKRISLEQMEQRLMQLDEIEEAAVVLLNDGNSHVGRSRLGAALVLSPSGRQVANDTSPAQFNERIKQALAAWFELTVLPRSWVIVERLPENAQGKRTATELQKLFTLRDQPPTELPIILHEQQEADEVTLQCVVPEDLLYFDGHFDALPVVAGVVQIHWAMLLAEKYFGVVADASQLEAIKFHQLLFPRDPFTLTVKRSTAPDKIHFALFQDEQRFSSGRVVI